MTPDDTKRILPAKEVAAIGERAEAATPGPWKMCDCGKCGAVSAPAEWYAAIVTDYEAEKPREQVVADGVFIAAAREDVPALLASHEALRALATELADNLDTAVRVLDLEPPDEDGQAFIAESRELLERAAGLLPEAKP